MMHKRRSFSVSQVGSAEELAAKLTAHTWTLCTGFLLGDYLFLNDSTGEDGALEYAVLKVGPHGESYRQVESITFGWCSYEQALGYIQRTLAGEFDAAGSPIDVRVQSPEQHGRCPYCA